MLGKLEKVDLRQIWQNEGQKKKVPGTFFLIYIFIFIKFVNSIKKYRIFSYFGFIIFFILLQPLAIIIYNNIKRITQDELGVGINEMMEPNVLIPIIVIILLIKILK